jgi:nucleoside-diphosphate-sugar epimerase
MGSHTILHLLAAGHDVRTTVCHLKRESEVRAMLKEAGAEPGGRSSFFATDLAKDTGWPQAVAGCDYVQHVASLLPPNVPKHEDELIVPTARRDAPRCVLRATPALNAWW